MKVVVEIWGVEKEYLMPFVHTEIVEAKDEDEALMAVRKKLNVTFIPNDFIKVTSANNGEELTLLGGDSYDQYATELDKWIKLNTKS